MSDGARPFEARAYLVLALISLGLCAAVHSQTKLIALGYCDNVMTFEALRPGGQFNDPIFPQEWRTRLFSVGAAALFAALDERADADYARDEVFVARTCAWTAMWLLLTNLVILATRQTRALLCLLGTYACVSFGYLAVGDGTHRVYPWDMPALFTFWCFIALVHHGRMRWLLLLLPIAVGFKETAAVLCVAFLFWEREPWRRRWLYFALAVAACIAVKTTIDLCTHSPRVLLTMTAGDRNTGSRLLYNMRFFTQFAFTHPAFINAGTLLAFLLLPVASQRMWMLKTICVLFSAGILVCGIIAEYRIWFEMIPIALYGIETYFDPTLARPADVAVAPTPEG